jgi:uncharacterized protein (DUF433 family)
MLLEDYFDFLESDVIRIRGHRIGIEDVIELYEQGYSAEQVSLHYPTLTLEEIYATFTFYLRNKSTLEAYIERLRQLEAESIREYERREPSEAVKRIRALRETRATYQALPDTAR